MKNPVVVALLIVLVLGTGGFVFWKYKFGSNAPAPVQGYINDESAIDVFSTDLQSFTTEEQSLDAFDAMIDDVLKDQGSDKVSAATLDSDIQSLDSLTGDIQSATQEQSDIQASDSTYNDLQN